MQVSKWGNSLAIRLPSAVVEVLQLKEGDDIEIHVAGTRALDVARKPDRQDVLPTALSVILLPAWTKKVPSFTNGHDWRPASAAHVT